MKDLSDRNFHFYNPFFIRYLGGDSGGLLSHNLLF